MSSSAASLNPWRLFFIRGALFVHFSIRGVHKSVAPDRFAAAIPSAGGLGPWYDVRRIADVPIWTFHDDAERGFVTHYASDRCDKTADVWEWLFAQKRGAKADRATNP